MYKLKDFILEEAELPKIPKAKIWQSIEMSCEPAWYIEKAGEFARELKEERILPLDVMTALEWQAVTPFWSILEFWHK